jgi:hypothetical protein
MIFSSPGRDFTRLPQQQRLYTLTTILMPKSYNNGAGQNLLHIVQTSLPDMTAASLLRMELMSVEVDDELSTVTFIPALAVPII